MLRDCCHSEIESCVERFRQAIVNCFPSYAEEIEAIATGAQLPAWQIYALNCRTELLMHYGATKGRTPNECTALYFRETKLLGQTWDWIPELAELAVVMRLDCPEGHSILMLTEPGIIGKIGINSHGVAVSLNILDSQHPVEGVPVHLLLRSVLDSEST